MEHLISLVLTVVGKLVGAEIEAWAPVISRKIIERSVRNFAKPDQERFLEEWLAHLNDCPGNFGKLSHALGCLWSANKIVASAKSAASAKRRKKRIDTKLLLDFERPALAWWVHRLPAYVKPNHLTALGLLGAVVAAAGFTACHASNGFLALVVLGLFIDWCGGALGEALARHRQIERPRYGYFIDHAHELVAQSLIIAGLGMSPYFTLFSALLVLSMYLLISSYTYLKVIAADAYQLCYGGIRVTEFRLLVGLWALFGAWIGPEVTHTQLFGHVALDISISTLWALTFVAFIYLVRAELIKIGEPTTEGNDTEIH